MSAVPLQRVKDHLNLKTSTHDGELQGILNGAESLLASKVGPLVATSTTSRVDGGDVVLALPVTPVLELTSVTPVGGTALTLSDLVVSAGGLVEWVTGGRFADRRYVVVYDAGRDRLPYRLEQAVLELVRHLWDTQRGPTRRPGAPASDGAANTVPGAAYALPFRVAELIADDLQVGI